MKYLILLFVCLIVLLSCSKRKEYNKKIIGKWVGGVDSMGGFNGTSDTLRFLDEDSLAVWKDYYRISTLYKYYYKQGTFVLHEKWQISVAFETDDRILFIHRNHPKPIIYKLRRI